MSTDASSELGRLSAARTAELVRAGEVSPKETIDAAIARIEECDGTLNAVVYTAFDEARERARLLEQRILSGGAAGPLAGVPSMTKDSFSSKKGWPVSSGLKLLRGTLATRTTNYPRRFEEADAILLGTTNSSVFGFRGTTDSKAFGPCRNPHNPEFNAGGSSGGSAAAVAARYVPIAGATDVGGSIRIPSSWCGTFGFQPSPGRAPFPAHPNLFGPSPYFFEGPISRTVEDAALAMEVLQGFDSGDPAALPGKVDYLDAYRSGHATDLAGVRIGVTPDYGIFPVDRTIRRVFDQSLRVLERLGADLVEVDLALPYSQGQLSDLWSRLTAIGTYTNMELLRRRGIDLRTECADELPDAMMTWVDTVATMSMDQLVTDQTTRSEVFLAFERTFANLDLLVAPTLATGPVRNAVDGFTQGPTHIEGEAVDPLIGWCMAYLTNFTGNPSASIPAGSLNGLPVGLQIMGPRQDDRHVIAASAAFEREAPWDYLYEVPLQGGIH